MPRLLLIVPTTTYRAKAFIQAALRLDVDLTVASEQPNTLAALEPTSFLTLDFAHPDRAVQTAVAFANEHRVDAVVPVDDEASVVAARIAEALTVPHNPVDAVHAARRKDRCRERLAGAGLLSPAYTVAPVDEDPAKVSSRVRFPCVLKPVMLSGSRGVIRADGPAQFGVAFRRIAALLRRPELARSQDAHRWILVEDFIPGREIALEGLLDDGQLRVLALFDKPDPLDGPFFAETFYVTPSRLEPAVQRSIADCTLAATRALGLRRGPIHAELRVNDRGPWVVEIAPRSIGGFCARVLRFADGMSLEELILRDAMGLAVASYERERGAAGVMMIPTLSSGILGEVRGLDRARAVEGIEEIIVSAHPGQRVEPLPEGAVYLGFIFARAETPAAAEAALREAFRNLDWVIAPSPREESP